MIKLKLGYGCGSSAVGKIANNLRIWNAYSTKQRYNYKCERESLEEIISHFGLKLMKK